MNRESLLQVGIDFREGKRQEKTWNELNDSMEKPFANGESFRGFVKKELKKLGKLKSREVFVSDEVQEKLDTIDIKIIELEKERKKVQTTKIEYNRLIRESARFEMIIEEIRKSIEAVEPYEFNPIIKKENNEKIGVLAFSDVHFGKMFVSLTNEYSEEIAYERMNNLIGETVKICKKEELDRIIIVNCADNLEGMCLRTSQLSNLSIGITDMTIRFSRFMVDWLNRLSEYLYVDYHHVARANHGQIRPFGTKANQFQEEDMERIVITYIHDMLVLNERIDILISDKDTLDFKIFDYNVIGLHGHKTKSIRNVIKDKSNQHRKFYDYAYLGHLHHAETITVGEGDTNNCEVLLVPSIMGADSYADDLGLGGKAGARLDVFEKNKGRAIGYNILLN